MKRNYYFLASSLIELIRGKTRRAGSVRELVDFCEEQLHPDDFESLKSLFLFNDIRNLIWHQNPDDPFVTPSYYTLEELTLGAKEPEHLLPFLQEHLANQAARTRLHSDLIEIDELTTIFYDHLGDIRDAFVREYYRNELNLRNISVALELRENAEPFKGKLIPTGEAYEQITRDTAEDFGLSDGFPYIRRLIPLFREPDLTAREELIEDIRWEWLDEWVSDDIFSSDFVFAYAVKLQSIERWDSLNMEKGDELFSELLNTVRRSVRFAIEFSKIEGTATAEKKEQ